MEERFELSFQNKEVRMWCYIMIPIIFVSILLMLFFQNSISPIIHFSPTIGWILYGFWRYFFQKKTK